MTSSGTYNYSLSNGEAVFAAFERIGVRAPELRQEHFVTARRELNDLFVELSNRVVNLWTVTRPEDGNAITMVQGTLTYTIPSNVVMILDAYISLNFGTTNQTDTYITPMSRTQYASLADKDDEGRPTSYWFDRTINPTVTMWPVPDQGGPYTFGYYACLQLQDANLPSGETPNMPYRWLGVLTAGLALRLARVYNRAALADCKADYADAWNWAAEQDTENVNTSYTPALSCYYRR
jgi:hypothetical protein